MGDKLKLPNRESPVDIGRVGMCDKVQNVNNYQLMSHISKLRILFFRENLVGSEVAGMKATFFANFYPTWTHILAPKFPNKEFFKQHFNFQSTRKTEPILLPIL